VAYEIEVDSLLLQGDSKGSVLLGLDVLRKLGVQFPRRISTTTVLNRVDAVEVGFGRRPLSNLVAVARGH
jgi:hypothetical protein